MQLHRSLPGEGDVRQLAALLVQRKGVVDGGLPSLDAAYYLERRRRSHGAAAGRRGCPEHECQHHRYGKNRNLVSQDRAFHGQG